MKPLQIDALRAQPEDATFTVNAGAEVLGCSFDRLRALCAGIAPAQGKHFTRDQLLRVAEDTATAETPRQSATRLGVNLSLVLTALQYTKVVDTPSAPGTLWRRLPRRVVDTAMASYLGRDRNTPTPPEPNRPDEHQEPDSSMPRQRQPKTPIATDDGDESEIEVPAAGSEPVLEDDDDDDGEPEENLAPAKLLRPRGTETRKLWSSRELTDADLCALLRITPEELEKRRNLSDEARLRLLRAGRRRWHQTQVALASAAFDGETLTEEIHDNLG